MFASHKTVLNTQNLNVGWLGWIYLRTLLLLEHLAVLIKSHQGRIESGPNMSIVSHHGLADLGH